MASSLVRQLCEAVEAENNALKTRLGQQDEEIQTMRRQLIEQGDVVRAQVDELSAKNGLIEQLEQKVASQTGEIAAQADELQVIKDWNAKISEQYWAWNDWIAFQYGEMEKIERLLPEYKTAVKALDALSVRLNAHIENHEVAQTEALDKGSMPPTLLPDDRHMGAMEVEMDHDHTHEDDASINYEAPDSQNFQHCPLQYHNRDARTPEVIDDLEEVSLVLAQSPEDSADSTRIMEQRNSDTIAPVNTATTAKPHTALREHNGSPASQPDPAIAATHAQVTPFKSEEGNLVAPNHPKHPPTSTRSVHRRSVRSRLVLNESDSEDDLTKAGVTFMDGQQG